MSEAEREAFLQEANVAILATVGPAGAHAVPIWYLYEDGAFLMSTGRGSQKHRDLERNPNVTLVVDRRALPGHAAVGRGAGGGERRCPFHAGSEFGDVASFKAGKSKPKPVELEELGDVRGRTMLHLQCHFGLDTRSWAREGAIVTGADFSHQAIATARALAAATGG